MVTSLREGGFGFMVDETSMLNKVPPHSLEAEQSVLGAMLLDKDAIAKAIDILVVDDFYREAHRIIFDSVVTLYNRAEPVDLIMVTELLRQKNALESVGGASYISSLANMVPTAANAEYYASIVKDKSIYRALVNAGNQISSMGFESGQDVEQTMDRAQQLIFNISQKGRIKTIDDMNTVLMRTFDRIERLYETKGAVTGVPTGFTEMDRMLSGLQPSELIIIAARPSMGKTALALNIATHVALSEKKPVLIFSLEMSQDLLAQRMLCAQASVNAQELRRGNLTDSDWPKLSQAIGRLSEAPIFIDDTPTISALEIRSRARKLKIEKGLGLIVIDYLQLIQGKGRTESRQQEIAEITRSLKSLARELEVPVLSLAQLSRAVEATADKKPMLSHLKESGEIEQSADVVAFIYRDEYYNVDTENKNIAEIIIAKQRNGPTGSFQLYWQKEYTRFRNLERASRGN